MTTPPMLWPMMINGRVMVLPSCNFANKQQSHISISPMLALTFLLSFKQSRRTVQMLLVVARTFSLLLHAEAKLYSMILDFG